MPKTEKGPKKQSTSFQLSEDGKRLLALLAAKNGVARQALIELWIRREAKKAGLE